MRTKLSKLVVFTGVQEWGFGKSSEEGITFGLGGGGGGGHMSEPFLSSISLVLLLHQSK